MTVCGGKLFFMYCEKRQKKIEACFNFLCRFSKRRFLFHKNWPCVAKNNVFKPAHAQKLVMKRASMEKSGERNLALLEHCEKNDGV